MSTINIIFISIDTIDDQEGTLEYEYEEFFFIGGGRRKKECMVFFGCLASQPEERGACFFLVALLLSLKREHIYFLHGILDILNM